MDLISEYHRNAAECLKLSRDQSNEAMREQFVRLAHWWLSLASAREQILDLLPVIDEIKPE